VPALPPSKPTAGRAGWPGRAVRDASAAAKAGTSEAPAVDEQVLGIVAAGDTGEATDLDAAVEHALADSEDEQAESDDDAAGDEETSD